ncbi:EF hand protein (macronuclear) [Tetrahymena thermophila SB210]|uniref:EF hand protein n=1 Tax=Tetrahymena thermophila (strain SB210) TaxID=312017 RepID=W7XD17_TETTS|nr:EF hand protein [Tetrahymena thermophila SB210]EWS74498.1 EF hand protein [Tetrahymena thermophila SB210]|eukprot:XP_012652983.1 EF hand protein [Tetrahymena thermophila SB210]
MIDSKKGLSESQQFKPPTYNQNVRYILAKQKIDDLFLKFLSQPTTNDVIQNLLRDIKSGTVNENNLPNPIFTSPKITLQNSMTSSTILLNSPISKSPQKHQPVNSPRSPSEKENRHKKNQLEASPTNNKGNKANNMSASTLLANSQLMQSMVVNKANYDEIPQFYFGEPTRMLDPSAQEEQNKIISEVFGRKTEIEMKDFNDLTTKLADLPNFFNQLLFNKIDKQKSGKISKQVFINYWKNELQLKDQKERCFHVLKKQSNEFIERDDFLPMMKVLLETHPGLEFLKATPEFQDRYADTVVIRIFFIVNRRDNGRISYQEFKKSNLFQVFQQVDKEEDINKIRDFFSYEHFYVLYCKFWELDTDHDFYITKEEFSKYSGHALSRKTVDRIFEQAPRKFKCTDPTKAGFMGYEDFIWFVLAEEDKTTLTSLEYWFKVVDLDDNGIITGFEMNWFFEEQRQRLEYLNHENVLFEDIVCQMVDLLKPEDDIKFYFKHFKAKQNVCGIFFNFMTNLNKLVQYEQRDPFQLKHELNEHPDYTEWDRFAQNEYQRLAMEEENQENGEVFNDGIDPWDQDGGENQPFSPM